MKARRTAGGRTVPVAVAGLVLLLTAAGVTAGCGPDRSSPQRSPALAEAAAGAPARGDGTPDERRAAPEPEPTNSAPEEAAEPDTAAAPPASAPEPTREPAAEPAGPPPPPPAPQPPDSDEPCPWYDGAGASRGEVRTALVTAAGHRFWPNDPITVPTHLMKAVAWQESGWQSTIIACDGGIGTMQIMPDTASWMNTRFGTSHDVDTLAGNTMIGAAYLEWLVKYFGDVWFDGSYDLNPAHCPQVTTPCLLNAVIASYNYGFGAVDLPDRIAIPNPQYVANVRALMTECVCLSY